MTLGIKDISIDNQSAKRVIDELLHLAQHPELILQSIGRQLKTNIQGGFDTSTSPYGEKWAALKVRKGGMPLKDRGHFRNGIDYQVSGDNIDVGVLPGPSLAGARLHQLGGDIKPVNAKALRFFIGGKAVFRGKVTIPARPYLPLDGLPPVWVDDILDAAAQAFTSKD
jgi:phage gpG-like protein